MITSKLDSLDLEPIMIKLMDQREGEGWSKEQASRVALLYRRFLYLNYKYPYVSIVPNRPVDTFWHYHILDTLKYAEDCQQIFGYFLHHFPYFGMRGEEDAKNLQDAFETTKELYIKEFGESLMSNGDLGLGFDSASVCDDSPNCYGKGCSGEKCGGKAIGDSLRPHFHNERLGRA